MGQTFTPAEPPTRYTCTSHQHPHSTCSEDPLQAIRGPRQWSSSLSRGACVGRRRRRVGLGRKVRRRVTSLHQHFGRTKQTHTVLAGQEDRLLHHLIADRAVKLLLHALHAGLEGMQGEGWEKEGGKVIHNA